MHSLPRLVAPFFVVLTAMGCSSSGDDGDASEIASPMPMPASAGDLSFVVLANGDSERIVMASFKGTNPSGVECTEETVAGCIVSTCTKNAPTSGPSFDPGTITASSKSLGTEVAVPTTGTMRIVQPGSFADGEEVRFVGAGSAQVAPFDVRVGVPAHAELRAFGGCPPKKSGEPACALTDPSAVVEWSGGGDGVVRISMAAAVDVSPRVSLSCAFAAGAGKGRIPAEAMQKLSKQWDHGVSLTVHGASASPAAGSGKQVSISTQRWLPNGSTSVKLAF